MELHEKWELSASIDESYLFKCYVCNENWNVMVYNPNTNEYHTKPKCLKCLNKDGTVWKKISFLTAFYSNVSYLKYCSYKNFRAMGKIYYSNAHPDKRKKNICVFRIDSELEIAVAKLFLAELEPNKDNTMKGVGTYRKGFYDTLYSLLDGSCEIYLTFILQIINSDTNLEKLIKDTFTDDQWSFCVISTVNIRSLIDKEKYIIHDIYIEP